MFYHYGPISLYQKSQKYLDACCHQRAKNYEHGLKLPIALILDLDVSWDFKPNIQESFCAFVELFVNRFRGSFIILTNESDSHKCSEFFQRSKDLVQTACLH